MSNLLVVNSTSSETRVALVEDGIISELHIERARDRGIVGNIYKGKILRVLPGMQASFIDISHERAGFLHASDVYDFDEDIAMLEEDGGDNGRPQLARGRGKQRINIQDSLKGGQEILVQVAKEPIGTKGARLTSHISLPGRYVVFMPTVSHIGISKRIESDKERKRLRKIVENARPPGTGFIVRTVSEGISDAKLKQDMEMLIKLWSEILEKHNKVRAPYLLYEQPDLVVRAVRDLVSADLEEIVLDDEKAYKRVKHFIDTYMPAFEGEVRHYQHDLPIFDAYGLEPEIKRSLQRKVDLESGGHLVIDRSEALTAIDVNTGKFVGKGNTSLEDTIVITNMEAADEVVYQLRLRNIGGLIIIDFIDMEDVKHREKVYRRLEENLKKDRVTSNALAISEFGLVEMTRKRVRESLQQFLCEPCEYCDSKGYVKSKETVAYEIIRDLKREAPVQKNGQITVHAHPGVVNFLRGVEKKSIKELEKGYEFKINIRSNRDLHIEDFQISAKS
jgi:ribonuclease G